MAGTNNNHDQNKSNNNYQNSQNAQNSQGSNSTNNSNSENNQKNCKNSTNNKQRAVCSFRRRAATGEGGAWEQVPLFLCRGNMPLCGARRAGGSADSDRQSANSCN